MKTARTILVLSLATGLCASAAVQAFCFNKGKHTARAHHFYNYPMPAIGFTPSQAYAYPYGSVTAGDHYGRIRPVEMPEPPESPQNGRIEGVEVWRY